MQVVCKGRTFWTYTLLFASLQLLGRLSAFSTSCTLPAPTLNTRMRSRDSVVLICQAPKDHQGVVFMLYRFREKVDSKDLQSSGEQVQFTVKVKEEDSGQGELFCCLYKNHEGCYSAFSPYLKLQHQTEMLPLPTLVLQQQTDLWHLLCTGSPAYPSAVFSLYLVGNEHPVATHHAKVFHHQATFPVPVLETHVALYQCQYSVLLGKNWSTSERSHPLNITRGIHPPSSPGLTNVDWPLVLGSFSAGVLFICSAALIVVVAQRKVKSAAEKKKKREEAQFWTKVRAKDHVVGEVSSPEANTSSSGFKTLHLNIQASTLRNGTVGTQKQLPGLKYGHLSPHLQAQFFSLPLCFSSLLYVCGCVYFKTYTE
ncbi:uncharacterized protein LOC113127701 isoform X4 [Mastacembelus armatus]|uniref:uncharacterized protein LOC113127701 isoform X4 n=1 Tax=Mastacembelus armatus TaxID=205130 RepID=UPI000E45C983|nr:uncharacterized protein LOC113127701 isoform X4 [Mastacembelus armatus]